MERTGIWHVKMTKPARGFKAGEIVEVPTQAHPVHAERWLNDGYAEYHTPAAKSENKRIGKAKGTKVVASA